MAKAAGPSRSERRARRAAVPEARVYGLDVVDAGAGMWRSEVVYHAATAQEADERRRAAGFSKRNSSPMPADQALADEYAFAAEQPNEMFLRRDEGRWTPWLVLPPGYTHPPQGAAARDPEVRRLPGENASGS